MKYKKSLIALLSLAFVSSAVAADSLKVGFANRTLNGPFFNGLTKYMEIVGQKNGYDVITTDARGDLNKQIADVEDMLAKGIDYLFLNPQDPAAGLRITEMAKDKGVPVLIIDSDISLAAPVITRVQANNAANNKLIGEYAVSQFGNNPMNCVFISGNQGNLVGEARRDNFILGVVEEQLLKYNESKLSIISQGWGNWDQQGGLKAMEDLLVSKGDLLNCVYTEMDDMALGAIRALKAQNKLNDVKIYAHDGYKKGILAVEKGEIQATASNNPEAIAEKAFEVISEYRAGKKEFPDYTFIKPILITKDNAKDIYNPDSIY